MQLTLPAIVDAEDYHEFDYLIQVLKKFDVRNVFYEELEFDGKYWAVFYEKGKKIAANKLAAEHELSQCGECQNW